MRRLATFENGEIVYRDMTPEEEATFDSAAATGNKTDAERIAALENENAELREQLAATMSAVDFILFGEV